MKVQRILRVLLASIALGLACNAGPIAHSVPLGTVVGFPDGSCADGTQCCVGQPNATSTPCVLPLDPLHGFPFLVQVTAWPPALQGSPDAGSDGAMSSLQSALTAQVSVISGPGTVPPTTTPTNMTAMPVAVPLNPDVDGTYSGIATLYAPGPGLVTVQADVAGSINRWTATIPAPVVVGQAAPTIGWTGSVPRYAVCVETSATEGIITLTSSDLGVLGTGMSSLSGTLVPGACPPPATVSGGPKTSHATFTIAFTPPWAVQATLGGMPNVEPGSTNPWAYTISQGTATTIDLAMTPLPSFSNNAPTGSIFLVTAQATPSVAGLPVSFSLQPMSDMVTPASVMTNANGNAEAYALVPFGSMAVAVASSGNFVAQASISNSPLALTMLSASPVPEPSDAGVDAGIASGTGGVLYTVSANAVGNAKPVAGAMLTFTALLTGGTPTTATATAMTDLNGNASTNILIPYSTSVVLEVSGGNGLAQLPPFANPQPSPTTGPITLDPTLTFVTQVSAAFDGGPGTVFAVTTTAVATSSDDAGTVAAAGVPVSFAVIFPTGTGAPTVMPASAMTDANGHATAVVAVPSAGFNGTSIQVEVSAGISVVDCEVLSGACAVASPDAGVPDGG